MTLYTAFGAHGNGADGPADSLSLGAAWTAGLLFEVTESGCQLAGYGQWITSDGTMTTDLTFALWQALEAGAGQLVTGSDATISTLTPGSWQYVSLATPIDLAEGTVYKVAVCSGASGCLPWESEMFGSGDYSAGVTSGPLTVFSSNATDGGSNPDSYGDPQGTFNENQSDPTAIYPLSGFDASNPWTDVQITTAAPPASPAGGLVPGLFLLDLVEE